jgi:dTDP-4-dehydrorhamnose reductase
MGSDAPRVLILGANGQVGHALTQVASFLGEVIALDRAKADLAKPEVLLAALSSLQPRVILNAAAYTAVDKAESDSELAHRVNAIAPGVLADYAAGSDALLVHYSTDYVFDGSGVLPRGETAPTAPLSVYGATKLEGEERIASSGCSHLIFRTSWVFDTRGQNFLRTMLRLAGERDLLSVIDDQVGVPTAADWLAEVTVQAVRLALQRPSLTGLYHCVPTGETTWFGYAKYIFDTARELGLSFKLTPEGLKAIPTADYPTPARRPLNSRLDTRKLQQAFGVHPPEWQVGVRAALSQIVAEFIC